MFASVFLTALAGVHASDFRGDASNRADGVTEVPPEIMEMIGQFLPEMTHAGAAFFSPIYVNNLSIVEQTTIDVIFLRQQSHWSNSLGYFTYSIGRDDSIEIHDSQIIWSNVAVSSGLQLGTTTTLRDGDGVPRVFTPGQRVGFFLVADGWNQESAVQDWQNANPGIPSLNPQKNASFGQGTYSSLDQLNPEIEHGAPHLARHIGMGRMPTQHSRLQDQEYLLCGVEDRNRTRSGASDCNDLLFAIIANTPRSIDGRGIYQFEEEDVDQDGIAGTSDHYPLDASRAQNIRFPDHGFFTVGLEDSYPEVGDADFNDVVVTYAFSLVTNADGFIKDIQGTFHLLARGSIHDHSLGIHIPGLPDGAEGTVRLERFLGEGLNNHQLESLTLQDVIQGQRRRIPDLIVSTKEALPPLLGEVVTNTNSAEPDRMAASARFHIEFDAAVDAEALKALPYDLFFFIHRNEELWDVHFAGQPGFPNRPEHLPHESGPGAFLDKNGLPWILHIPASWQFPLEKVNVKNSYPMFESWADAKGKEHQDWYKNQSQQPFLLGAPAGDYLIERSWEVHLPHP